MTVAGTGSATREAAVTVRRVITDTDFSWDGGPVHLSRGTILDVPPGSDLETAIGTGNLADLSDPVAAAAAAEQAGASN